jgi:hypothetical protein
MTKANPELKRLMSRDAFTNATRLREMDIPIPEVGTFRVRELNGDQRMKYLDFLEVDDNGTAKFGPAKQVRFNEFVISMGVIDGDGSRIFSTYDDVPDLRKDVSELLCAAILRLSLMLTDQARNQLASETKRRLIELFGEATNNPPNGGTRTSPTSGTP